MASKSHAGRGEVAFAGTLAAIIYFVATAIGHGNPLTGSSQLYGDFSNQYIGLMNFLHQVVLGRADAAYSFGSGLGGGMIADWAYYLLSPFNLLAMPFGPAAMPDVVYLIICLKVACAAAAFDWLARQRWTRLNPALRLTLALGYALMGYVMIYQREFMWLDALVFLPLIIGGLLRVLAGRSVALYTVSLAVMLVANYYVGFMICVFLPIFALYHLYAEQTELTGVVTLKRLGRFIWASLLAALSASIVLVPTFASLLGGKLGVNTGQPILPTTTHPLPVFSRLLIGAVDDHIDLHPGALSLPTLYVSGLLLISALLFFTLRRIAGRQKIGAALVFAFFLIVGFAPKLYLLMHGGANPVGYPYRYAFLIGFWLVYLAGDTLLAASERRLPRNAVFSAAGIALVFTVYLLLRRSALDASAWRILLTGLLWLAACFVLLMAATRWRRYWAVAALGLVVLDLGINAAMITSQKRTASMSDYRQYARQMRGLTNAIKADAGTNPQPYRVGSNLMRGIDRGDGLTYSYASASIFSSNLAKGTPALMRLLGQPSAEYYIQYSNGTALTDAIFGMDYLIGTTRDGKQENARHAAQVFGYRHDLVGKKVTTSGRETVYANPLAAPLAFVLPGETGAKLLGGDSLNNQSRILQSWSGDHAALTKPVKIAAPRVSYHGRRYTWTLPAATARQYVQLAPAYFAKHTHMRLNGKRVQIFPGYSTPVLLGVGKHAQAVKLTVTFKHKQKAALPPVTAAVIREAQLRRTVAKLQQGALHFSTRLGSHMVATATTTKSATVMTTIPADSGWHVKVDGKRVSTGKGLRGIFMTVPIQEAGKHTVQFDYHVPYWRLGVLMTLLGIALIVLVTHLDFLKNRGAHRRQLV
ncbi:YfhO family protein [Lacticaseibacillus pabuli]|uniref:YfhO family protein n=1 Tax=Lacticaseibacillus pabuli TaxID=3025672 RepID=A0ABY7WVP5_9LACO|nr:YfhO family protein [Lacticaseibacillus sp. KACC 23028]WDF83139.1 YfhO family protein [Lacticaseibacillus sp. KACC 23028]